MLIPEMAPYIYGEKTTRIGLPTYKVEADLYDTAAQFMADTDGVAELLNEYEKPKLFYKSNPDLAYLIPKYAQEEIFYALKNGYTNEHVPSKVLYLLNKAYKSVHSIPNLIFKVIPEGEFTVMFQEDYLDGVTMRDVICSFICEDYSPITYEMPIKKHDTYAEVYIQDTDMVAAIPVDIASGMSVADVRKLKVRSSGIYIEDIPLRTLGGRYGAANSIYDLRECL